MHNQSWASLLMLNIQQRQNVIGPVINAFKKIGYRPSLIRRDYQFADFCSLGTPARTIDLGVFGQEPLDYRSACFGLRFATEQESAEAVVKSMRALGAPQLLYVRDNETERWQVNPHGGVLADTIKTAKLHEVIQDSKHAWNPQSVIRAKSGFDNPGPRQHDLVDIGLLPALEHEAALKIDHLVRSISSLAEGYYKERRLHFDVEKIFALLFQLLVAKLLRDRGIVTIPVINFVEPQSVLAAVHNHYQNHDSSVFKSSGVPTELLASISALVGDSFPFSNLSVDTLTYIYENTFVSRSSRKTFGIHSTPSYLADYVMSQIPIEDLPRHSWNVLDPTCGHGIFLIAAMRRMRTLLPQSWSGQERHKFFIKHLHGVDIEKFSIEVARMCLMLADFPEANGWDLIHRDMFKGDLLESTVSETTLLVGNPPFECFTDISPQLSKPAELLRRALPKLQPGGFLGMVLPRAVLDGNDYHAQRRLLLKDFEIISVTGLPDRIFTYSDAETAVVVARKTGDKKKKVIFREVLDRDREAFKGYSKVSWEDSVPQSYFDIDKDDRLIVPGLREVWETLGHNPLLMDVANVRKGVEFISEASHPNRGEVIFTQPAKGRRKGVAAVTSNFMQFAATDEQYFSLDPSKRRANAWEYDWDKEKVILPASRNSRGPWRFAAALDLQGRLASRRFYVVWPKEQDNQIPAIVISAILNSPVAAAYVFAHSFQKDIPKRAYEAIPIPSLDVLLKSIPELTRLVDIYIQEVSKPQINSNAARQALLQIDATVLRLYDLTPRLERQVLDLFWDASRRVPFEFNGYMPPEYKPWIPLHMYISEGFCDSAAKCIFEHFPVVKDQEVLHYLQTLGN